MKVVGSFISIQVYFGGGKLSKNMSGVIFKKLKNKS